MKKEENLIKEQDNNTQKIDTYLNLAFNKLIQLKLEKWKNEGIKKIIIPSVAEAELSTNTMFKVKHPTLLEPTLGSFILLNYLSTDFVDNEDNVREFMLPDEMIMEEVANKNLTIVCKMMYLSQKIDEALPFGETRLKDIIYIKNQENQETHTINTKNIVKAYEGACKELNIPIDYESVNFLKFKRGIVGFISTCYIENKPEVVS